MADSDLTVNYENVLADLRAKRDKLNAAIAGIETMLGIMPADAPSGELGANDRGQQEVQFDTFFGLSIPDAVRKLLNMRKRAMPTQEIASALEAGGLKHQSGAFGNTVGSVLNRIDKAGGDIVKVGRAQWGLASWYPNMKRRRNGGKPGQDGANGDSDPHGDESDEPT